MNERVIPEPPAWIQQIFDAQAVEEGKPLRRKIVDVEKYAGFAELLDEVKRREFHLIETGDQYVILCNEGSITIHC